MYSSEIMFSEIEDRLNARYYGPHFLSMIRLIKNLGKSPKYRIYALRDITSKVRKGIFYILASEYKESGIPFIRVSDIKALTIDDSELVYISDAKNHKEKKTSLKSRDIVLSKGGTIGRVALIPSWMKKCNISQDVIGVSLRKDSPVEPEYVALFLASKPGKMQMERVKTQQMQPHLSLGYARDLKILQSLDFHDDVVSWIQSAERMNLKSYQLIEQAINHVYESLDLTNEINTISSSIGVSINFADINDTLVPRYYDHRNTKLLAKVKSQFETVTLQDIAQIGKGHEAGSINYRQYLEKNIDDIPFIRTSDIVNYEVDLFPDYCITEEVAKNLNQEIKQGSILFTKDGKIGRTAMLCEMDNCVVSSGFSTLTFDSDMNYYCFAILASELGRTQAWRNTVIASTIPHLNSPKRLGKIEIPMIDEKDMKKIGQLIKEAYTLKNQKKKLLSKSIEKIESIFD